jgi:hypothetical protein
MLLSLQLTTIFKTRQHVISTEFFYYYYYYYYYVTSAASHVPITGRAITVLTAFDIGRVFTLKGNQAFISSPGNAANWLFHVVLHASCSTASSASARTSRNLKCFLGLSAYLTEKMATTR